MKFSSHAIVELNVIDRPICILEFTKFRIYEGWNFNSGNYLFTTDTK